MSNTSNSWLDWLNFMFRVLLHKTIPSLRSQLDFAALLHMFLSVTQPHIADHLPSIRLQSPHPHNWPPSSSLSPSSHTWVSQGWVWTHVPVENHTPSSSCWASPLHKIPKKTPRDWCPCRDYCAPTVPPRIVILSSTFRISLHHSMVPLFSVSWILYMPTYHQIPVEPSGIPRQPWLHCYHILLYEFEASINSLRYIWQGTIALFVYHT